MGSCHTYCARHSSAIMIVMGEQTRQNDPTVRTQTYTNKQTYILTQVRNYASKLHEHYSRDCMQCGTPQVTFDIHRFRGAISRMGLHFSWNYCIQPIIACDTVHAILNLWGHGVSGIQGVSFVSSKSYATCMQYIVLQFPTALTRGVFKKGSYWLYAFHGYI